MSLGIRQGRKVPSSTQPIRIVPSASNSPARRACCAISRLAWPRWPHVDADLDHVVEARRPTIAHRRLADDEGDAGLARAAPPGRSRGRAATRCGRARRTSGSWRRRRCRRRRCLPSRRASRSETRRASRGRHRAAPLMRRARRDRAQGCELLVDRAPDRMAGLRACRARRSRSAWRASRNSASHSARRAGGALDEGEPLVRLGAVARRGEAGGERFPEVAIGGVVLGVVIGLEPGQQAPFRPAARSTSSRPTGAGGACAQAASQPGGRC